MRKMSGVCDYFVIASGTSTTQVRAIADHIQEKLAEKLQKRWHIEGEREASWLLLDYGDVVVHIFLEPTRRFYGLERLWDDAPQVCFKEAVRKTKRVKKRAKKTVRKIKRR